MLKISAHLIAKHMPRTRRGFFRKKRTKHTSADAGLTKGRNARNFLQASVVHEVHAYVWCGTHGLKLYVFSFIHALMVSTMKDTESSASLVPMCETFSNLVSARTHVMQAFRNERCFMNRSTRACDWEEEAETEAPSACPDPECSSLFNEMCLSRRHKHMNI